MIFHQRIKICAFGQFSYHRLFLFSQLTLMASNNWKRYDMLTPLGFYGTRKNFGIELREPDVFSQLKMKFKAAELAYLVAGTHSNKMSEKMPSGLWKGFEESRNESRGPDGWKFGLDVKNGLLALTFDLVHFVVSLFSRWLANAT